jgi:hypothetical protein
MPLVDHGGFSTHQYITEARAKLIHTLLPRNVFRNL